MMAWIFLTLALGLAAFFAASPFLRAANNLTAGGNRKFLYQRQIEEIDAEESSGVLSNAEAASLRVEAQRRLLAAAHNNTEPQQETAVALSRTTTALIIAGMVVAGGAGLYALMGSPGTPSASRAPMSAAAARSQPNAAPAAAAQASAVDSVDSMIGRLIARLEEDPDNADGWRMLGWSYFNVGDHAKSAEAYARAIALAPNNSSYHSARGEALVRAAGGFVTQEALDVFDKTLSLDPGDPRARFFKGLALDQSGDAGAAIDAWIALIDSAPPGADWVDDLRQRVFARAQEAGIDISGKLAPADERPKISRAPSPTIDQIQTAMQKPAEDRQLMIEGMVASLAARLEQNPDDPDGWVRLIRSKTVLGRQAEARADLQKAVAAFADKPDTRARIIAEARALGVALQ